MVGSLWVRKVILITFRWDILLLDYLRLWLGIGYLGILGFFGRGVGLEDGVWRKMAFVEGREVGQF